MKILTLLLSLYLLIGCTAGGETAKARPANMSRKEYNTKLKVEKCYGFWMRNDDLPFSIIPFLIDGMRQFDGHKSMLLEKDCTPTN
jgi:hypothetical protein